MDGGAEFETPPDLAAGFAAFWTAKGAPKNILLAVSGGADSVALMRLAAPLKGRARIHVATVDHGLRTQSAAEAAMVSREANALGLSHATLRWTGDKPASGLQAAARAARYRLLIEHAAASGAEAIVTAHNADDQAETVLMRLARGSGPRGLSAMADDTLIAAGALRPVRLLRPLLDSRRLALRSFVAMANAPFVDDPSNEDQKFERVRTRRLISEFEAADLLGVDALVATATEMRAAAVKIEAAENARWSALGGRFSDFGAASLRDDGSDSDIGLLARLIGAVGGGDYPPSETQAASAFAAARASGAATLGGALIEIRDGEIAISREKAAVFGRAGTAPLAAEILAPGETRLWDRRFIVENLLGEAAELRAISPQEADLLGLENKAAGAPALRVGGEIVALPGENDGFASLAEERFYRRVNRFQ